MKLDKKTRERLYKAQGKSVEISWPEDAPEPHSGQRYPVYTENGEKAFSVLLERSKRARGLKAGTKALVKIDNDPRRIMVGLKGVRTERDDYETEPERVHADYEELIAQEGRLKTVMAGATHRQRATVLRREQRLIDARKKEQPQTVRTLERVGKAA